MRTRTAYVAFDTAEVPSLTVAGKLSVPTKAEGALDRSAAVLICHGSDGVDGRGEFHAGALHAAGIATLEIDMWAARGTVRGAAARPASPVDTLPDAFAALAFLAVQPELDPGRIGIMGFSWGGAVSLLAARRRSRDGLTFAAHAALYPVCWAYTRVPAMALTELTGAPILIQTGEADAYDAPGAGETLAASLRAAGWAKVRAIAHPGATHGFDRDLPAQTITDPFAHEGRGGSVLMEFHEAAATAAREEIVRFLGESFARIEL
ncbi:MAG: dienelactone hydrolase family protein [Caulobacteraceae bacterium]